MVPAASSSSPLSHLTPHDQALFYSYGLGPRRTLTREASIIHHTIERHARERPSALAVEHISCNEHLTYGALSTHSNRLAHLLRAHGVVPGKRVCILARRSLDLIVGIVGILKSGAQYVPLDAQTIADETLQFVLEDAKPAVVLVMAEYAHRVVGSRTIILESVFRPYLSANEDVGEVEDLSDPDDGAYVIYTSGTTGRPKGVDVRHRGVTNVISGSPGNVGMRPGMRVAQLLNIAFDMGAWEILGSLYNGCTLCLRGNTSKEWAAVLRTVHVVIATPSMLIPHEPENYPTIEYVIVGGEPCPQALADKWARYTAFHNCCGPTEISICNTVQLHSTPTYPLSIGTPIPNTNVYILSRDPSDTTPARIGEVGCMWVGGVGVSRGYLNLPEKTAERWRRDVFVDYGCDAGSGEGVGGEGWMFNTGDLGKWREDGQLEHMGRADDQVKVKGFRVELDGVSAAMRTHTPVRSAVTLLISGHLWGFITPSSIDTNALRHAVAKSQPSYAVPKYFYAMDEFPLTSNGKVDKRALRALAEGLLKEEGEEEMAMTPVTPDTPMQAYSVPSTPLFETPSVNIPKRNVWLTPTTGMGTARPPLQRSSSWFAANPKSLSAAEKSEKSGYFASSFSSSSASSFSSSSSATNPSSSSSSSSSKPASASAPSNKKSGTTTHTYYASPPSRWRYYWRYYGVGVLFSLVWLVLFMNSSSPSPSGSSSSSKSASASSSNLDPNSSSESKNAHAYPYLSRSGTQGSRDASS